MREIPFDQDPMQKLRSLVGDRAGAVAERSAETGRRVIADAMRVVGTRVAVGRYHVPRMASLPRPRFESGEPSWLCVISEDARGTRLAWWIDEEGAIFGATDRGSLPVEAALADFDGH